MKSNPFPFWCTSVAVCESSLFCLRCATVLICFRFWSLYTAYNNSGKDADTYVMDLAITKLLGMTTFTGTEALTDAAMLAVLDVLLSLRYHPQRASTQTLAESMVASHMRTVFSAPASRTYLHSGYSSEPILAEAALRIVALLDMYFLPPLRTLRPSSDGISPSTSGESVSTKPPTSASTKPQTSVPGPDMSVSMLIDPQTAPTAEKLFEIPTPVITPENAYPQTDSLAYMLRHMANGNEGAIDMGQRGENMIKIVLVRSYMAAVRIQHSDDNLPDIVWSRGCLLTTFLRCLFAESAAAGVMVALPDNVRNGKPLEEALPDAWVRFTHFVRAGDDTGMTSEMALVAFTRGMAVIGWGSQARSDFSISFMINRHHKVCETNMSVILLQIKNHFEKGGIADYTIDEKEISTFPSPGTPRYGTNKKPPLYDERPYITIVMEVGITEKIHPDAYTPSIVTDAISSARGTPTPEVVKEDAKTIHHRPASPSSINIILPPVRSSERLSAHAKVEHPRYNIFIYGCSPTVYRSITTQTKDVYRQLLERGQVLGEHPRPPTIPEVRQMKPFWAAGYDCFGWSTNKFLNKELLQLTVAEDRVVHGTRRDEGRAAPA